MMVTRKSFQKSGRKAAMSVLDGVGAYGGQTYARIPVDSHSNFPLSSREAEGGMSQLQLHILVCFPRCMFRKEILYQVLCECCNVLYIVCTV